MITGTFLMLTSCVAWSTATVPWLWLSRVSVDELAAADAAGVVEVAERHLDRLRAGLAVGAGRSGQFHDQADGDVAVGGRGRQRRGAEGGEQRGGEKQSSS